MREPWETTVENSFQEFARESFPDVHPTSAQFKDIRRIWYAAKLHALTAFLGSLKFPATGEEPAPATLSRDFLAAQLAELQEFGERGHRVEEMCSFKGCPCVGHWRPVLLIRPPAPHDGEAPALLELAFCDAHKLTMTLDDVLTDQGWKNIEDGFSRMGAMKPARGRTRFKFIRIEDDVPGADIISILEGRAGDGDRGGLRS